MNEVVCFLYKFYIELMNNRFVFKIIVFLLMIIVIGYLIERVGLWLVGNNLCLLVWCKIILIWFLYRICEFRKLGVYWWNLNLRDIEK